MDCEICGMQIVGKGRSVIIDGAKLVVCQDCVKSAPRSLPPSIQQTVVTRKSTSTPPIRQQRSARNAVPTIREDLELIEGFGSIVRKAREKLGITHEELSRKIGERISLIQKLESGKMVPSQTVANKLEYALKIKILQPPSLISVEEEFAKKPAERTLSDFVSIPKKGDKTED